MPHVRAHPPITVCAALVAVCAMVSTMGIVTPASAARAAAGQPAAGRPTIAYQHLALPDNQYALVYSDGVARVVDPRHGTARLQYVPLRTGSDGTPGALPAKPDLIATLAQGHPAAYAPDEVLVGYAGTVSAPDRFALNKGTTGHPVRPDPAHPAGYTRGTRLNALFARLGVDRADRLVADATSPSGSVPAADGQQLDISRVYRLHLTPGRSVPDAVTALRADTSVDYAAPNWRVVALHTDPVAVDGTTRDAAAKAAPHTAAATGAAALPDNYGLTASAQSLLNRPGVNAAAAYSTIAATYGQLPGQGQVITNVSLGGLTDQAAVGDAGNPCDFWASAYGPTTVVQNGQRYLDWPGMPLIPTYTADGNGSLDPTGQVCGPDDPTLVEVGLDFSMMAPLPHDKQRPGREGNGLTDLLGIAPGASYRLVEPHVASPGIADVAAAFLAAARQRPAPTVITASLGFGLDQYGFSGRYLEDDPLMASVIATIVHRYRIVVCVSAGDGLRQFTNAPVPPSGGSVATERAGGPRSNLDDVGYSTAPSVDPDTGSLDVGSSTLDDVASAPPQYPQNAARAATQAYAETRYNGARNFASGYGSRVSISAPGDNVLSLGHSFGGSPSDVTVYYNGGTSASAPQVAAAAAVVLQVAALTGARDLVADPVKLRDFLVSTGSPVANPAQSDVQLTVGPQVDLGNAVQTLLARAHRSPQPSVPRVAVVDRHPLGSFDGTFSTATDPSNIPLDHLHRNDWLTIAPDWVGVPDSADYALTVGGRQLASTPWARLAPADLLAAAGLPMVADAPRTVTVTYTASTHSATLASATVPLTFGPSDGLASWALAPRVPAVVRGDTIPVTYDLTGVTKVTDPVLVVSEPGRIDPVSAPFFRPAYTLALTAPSGTVQVPVAALQGGGIYGIAVQQAPGGNGARTYTNVAYTRVAPAGDARPPAPTLAAKPGAAAAGHYLEIPYAGTFAVGWDVRNVPAATGAIVEISAPGPTMFNNQNTFNNPNGSGRDANGKDSGSIYAAPVKGTNGTVTLSAAQVGLAATMSHVVRVLPTRDGRVVGEASEVSTVTRDGVRPIGGGDLSGGFGINTHGSDGMLTVNQATGSVQVFDQNTNAVTRTVTSSTSQYQTPGSIGGGPGVLTGDVGLYERFDSAGGQAYEVVKPVATGGDGGAWTPPATHVTPGDYSGALPAPNQQADETAFLFGHNGPDGGYRVFTSNVGANTFGPAHDVQPALAGLGFPFVTGFGADNTQGQAVLAASDFFTSDAPPTFVTVDLDSGKTGTFTGVGAGTPDGLAIDSGTHTMVVPTDDGLVGVYDLNARTGADVSPGGGFYQHPAADDVNHLFAVQELEGPGGIGGTPADNNALSGIVILDGRGSFVRRIAAFNFFNTYLPINGSYVQLNPSTRTGYTLGPGATQLAPFHY